MKIVLQKNVQFNLFCHLAGGCSRHDCNRKGEVFYLEQHNVCERVLKKIVCVCVCLCWIICVFVSEYLRETG